MQITYYANNGTSEYYSYDDPDVGVLSPQDCGFSTPAGYEFACWSSSSTLENAFQVKPGFDTSHFYLRSDSTGSAVQTWIGVSGGIQELYAIWKKAGTTITTEFCADAWSNYTTTTSADLILDDDVLPTTTTLWTNTTGEDIRITWLELQLATGSGHFVNTSTGLTADGSGHKLDTRMQISVTGGQTYNCDYITPVGVVAISYTDNFHILDENGGSSLAQEYVIGYSFESSKVIIPAGGSMTMKFDKSIAPVGVSGWVLCSGRGAVIPDATRLVKLTYSQAVANTVWVYDGTTWVKSKTLKKWNGTTWEDMEINHY